MMSQRSKIRAEVSDLITVDSIRHYFDTETSDESFDEWYDEMIRENQGDPISYFQKWNFAVDFERYASIG